MIRLVIGLFWLMSLTGCVPEAADEVHQYRSKDTSDLIDYSDKQMVEDQNDTVFDAAIRYLALGDSYTIGEGVTTAERWPSLLTALIRKGAEKKVQNDIIAQTGWTSTDLRSAINYHKPQPGYQFVSLLIGVNNQYRGMSKSSFEQEFELLLKTAMELCNTKHHVFVLSIPDYSVTPYAAGRDREKIALEIAEFNEICRSISAKHRVQFFDITPISRQASADLSLLAADQLHPSGKMYQQWVNMIEPWLIEKLP